MNEERVHLGWGTVVARHTPDGRLSLTGKRTVGGLGREHTVNGVLPLDLIKWLHGTLIQDAMPYLSDSDREFLMSGITPDEWDAMWAEEGEWSPEDVLGGEG